MRCGCGCGCVCVGVRCGCGCVCVYGCLCEEVSVVLRSGVGRIVLLKLLLHCWQLENFYLHLYFVLYFCPSVSLSLSVFLSRSLSLSQPLSLSASLSDSLPLSVSLCRLPKVPRKANCPSSSRIKANPVQPLTQLADLSGWAIPLQSMSVALKGPRRVVFGYIICCMSEEFRLPNKVCLQSSESTLRYVSPEYSAFRERLETEMRHNCLLFLLSFAILRRLLLHSSARAA